jgi:two-component system heavy metal sensor histidine kinase CusS
MTAQRTARETTSLVPKLPESGVQPAAERAEDANEQLARAQRYIMDAAHELLTPLTTMHGELCLALRRQRQQDADQAALEELLDQTKHLISLSRDLLTLAAVGAPDARPNPVPVNVPELIEQALESTKLSTEATERIRSDIENATILGRRADLLRLVRNLLDNALEYGPAEGIVRVSARVDAYSDTLCVIVEDDGQPIPHEISERIFEPFFRAPASCDHPGSGLGLAIAREIAHGHGGSLILDTTAASPRFVVRLPLLRDSPE